MRVFHIAAVVFVMCLAGAAFHASLSASAGQTTAIRVREVNVIAARFEFSPNRIEVEQGDHVKITVRSADGTHGFAIKSLGVRAKVPRDGEPVIVEFDANRKGTFEIACFEYCGTGHRTMKATLVVNPTNCREAGRD